MKSLISKLLAFTAVTIVVIGSFNALPAHATTNYNDLMDDSVFDESDSMTASQIDSWINTYFPSSCISTNNGFSANDPTGYSPTGGFTYGGNVSAGQVIADAAKAYDINPQVLIATMQKEQSLVSGAGGCGTLAYTGTMGYGCPDGGTTYSYNNSTLVTPLYFIHNVPFTSVSGTCVNTAAKAGFSEQVIHAAWLLKFGEQRSEGNTAFDVQLTNSPQPGDHWDNSDDPQTCYAGPMTQGTYKRCSTDTSATYFDGSDTIDGMSIHIDTGPTAALYWYTPHLSGNNNFDNIFQQYFGQGSIYGNTIGSQAYRLWSWGNLGHYYTARQSERASAESQGYSDDGIAFDVGTSATNGMVPIYNLYNGGITDHWLLPDGPALYWAVNYGGYADQGVAFYAYVANPNTSGWGTGAGACAGTATPSTGVYQMWQGGHTDHFYSINPGDRYWALIYGGYIDDNSGIWRDSDGASISFCVPTS